MLVDGSIPPARANEHEDDDDDRSGTTTTGVLALRADGSIWIGVAPRGASIRFEFEFVDGEMLVGVAALSGSAAVWLVKLIETTDCEANVTLVPGAARMVRVGVQLSAAAPACCWCWNSEANGDRLGALTTAPPPMELAALSSATGAALGPLGATLRPAPSGPAVANGAVLTSVGSAPGADTEAVARRNAVMVALALELPIAALNADRSVGTMAVWVPAGAVVADDCESLRFCTNSRSGSRIKFPSGAFLCILPY